MRGEWTALLVVDAVAHIHPHLAEAAIEMMQRNMRAEVGPAEKLRL